MKFLISNDDGVEAPGIIALSEAMKGVGEVTVVAPHRERSTTSHALTLHKPLRAWELEPKRFATSGGPADCIYLGARKLTQGKPDFVLSGINRGANLGTDVHYSGTVAAAREGALMGIPSLAFSLVDKNLHDPNIPATDLHFKSAASIARIIVEKTLGTPFPDHTLLNINIPNLPLKEIKGIRICTQGVRYYKDHVAERKDPRNRPYYWIGGPYSGFKEASSSDCQAVEEGFVALVPISVQATHQEFYSALKESDLDNLKF